MAWTRAARSRATIQENVVASPLIHRTLVASKLPVRTSDLIRTGHAIIVAMSNNPHFPNPNPPLATLTASLTALDTAQTATKTRAQGTVAARNAARLQFISDLHAAKAYVQQVADANPEQAEAIITSAGMAVRKAPARVTPDFAATPGAVSGQAKLRVKSAGARACYDWEWSADGAKTWTTVPSTLQARTVIGGLPVATNVLFRVRAVTKTGEGDWSQPTGLLIK